MMNEIEKSIGELSRKAGLQQRSDDAMKYTQAVLNLAQARSVIRTTPDKPEVKS